MGFLVNVMLFGWIPMTIYLFSIYPPDRAFVISSVGAILFLPQSSFVIPSLIPDITRVSAVMYGVVIGTFLFHPTRFQSFRWSWIDIPVIILFFVPIPTNIVNGLSFYDATAQLIEGSSTWILPYIFGRIYLGNFESLKKAAIAIFIGGALYVPICLYESRTQVSVHGLIYGFIIPQQSWLVSIRYGGYRPAGFMVSGLMTSLWLLGSTLTGFVVWRNRLIKSFWGVPVSVLFALALFAFLIMKSTGAYVLFALGVLILFIAKWFKTSFLVWVISGAIAMYLYLGASGNFPGKQLIDGMLQAGMAPDRVSSMKFRFDNEELLSAKARQSPLFGWGGFGRNRVFNEKGEDISVTDSLWIIAYGVNGAVGLASTFAVQLLPALAFTIRFPARLWSNPIVEPAAVLMLILVCYAFDNTSNAMTNTVFHTLCGGIAGVTVSKNPVKGE